MTLKYRPDFHRVRIDTNIFASINTIQGILPAQANINSCYHGTRLTARVGTIPDNCRAVCYRLEGTHLTERLRHA